MAVAPPDLHVQPEVGTIGLLDFHRTDEGIEAGRQAALAIEADLKQLAAKQSQPRQNA